MNNYPEFLSKKRLPVETPKNLVDENGKIAIGTFDQPFKNLNLMEAKKPYGYPMSKRMKKLRMKDWEAIEISLDEGLLASDIYCVGPLAYNAIIYFEYATGKIYRWTTIFSPNKQTRHSTLLDSEMYCKAGKSYNHFKNIYKDGKAIYHAEAKDKKLGEIKIDIELTNISDASNVFIPMGKNSGVYSQKNFFRAKGKVVWNDKEIHTNENTMAIIDDHKAFYPFKMHYYWLTGIGVADIDGKKQPLAFNLCRNQSINQDDYNENLLWLENKSFVLPPVKFELQKDSWRVFDEHGMVDVKIDLAKERFRMFVPLGIFKMDYGIPFGKLSGYIKDYDGKKYDVSSLGCMGEDVSYRI